jgi:hypothetical protein
LKQATRKLSFGKATLGICVGVVANRHTSNSQYHEVVISVAIEEGYLNHDDPVQAG